MTKSQQIGREVAKKAYIQLTTPAQRATFSAITGSFAGMVSAITGLGGAVVFDADWTTIRETYIGAANA